MTNEQSIDVLVIGGTVAGAVAALECSRLGLRVTILGELPHLFPEQFRDDAGGWRWLSDSLSAEGRLSDQDTFQSQGVSQWFVRGVSGAPVPVPGESIFGIPSSPLSDEVVQAVGRSASMRAYFDRIRPVLTIGKEHNLAHLVSSRMGIKILDVFVSPLIHVHFGAPAEAVDVAVAIPGLNEAITRTGSLSTGVLACLESAKVKDTNYQFRDEGRGFGQALRGALEYWNVNVVNPEGISDDEQKKLIADARAVIVACGLDQSVMLLPDDIDRNVTTAARPSSVWRFELGDLEAPASEALMSAFPDGLIIRQHQEPFGTLSIRIRHLADHAFEIAVTGDRVSRRLADITEDVAVHDLDEVLQVLVGVMRQATTFDVSSPSDLEERFTLTRWNPMELAPITTLAESYALNRMYEELNENESQRFVLEWLFGGSTSATIVAARDQAQSLRRGLLGIS